MTELPKPKTLAKHSSIAHGKRAPSLTEETAQCKELEQCAKRCTVEEETESGGGGSTRSDPKIVEKSVQGTTEDGLQGRVARLERDGATV